MSKIVFDESKVINALHPEKAEVGKKYWCADSIGLLKDHIENNDFCYVCELESIGCCSYHRFESTAGNDWDFLYPYEEPEPQYRPYESIDELIADWEEKTHSCPANMKEFVMPLIWVKTKDYESFNIIYSYDKKNNRVSCRGLSWGTLGYLFDNYTFLDGSPCGKEIK